MHKDVCDRTLRYIYICIKMYVIGLKSSSETLVFVCFSVTFFFPFCPLVSSLLECYFFGNGRTLNTSVKQFII